MKKRTIQIIISLMSIALVGIATIQAIWLKTGFDLNANTFDYKVNLVLSNVKQQLLDDANQPETFTKGYSYSTSSIFNIDRDPKTEALFPSSDYSLDKLKKQIGNLAWLTKPSLALDLIAPNDLDKYLNKELDDQGLALEYDYGIFSNDSKSFTIMNGAYYASIGNVEEASQGAQVKKLERSLYQVDLFETEGREPAGSLRLFFPKKASFLLSSILPSLISSIVFTGLILFCFIYTINVILTQKKVSIMKTDFINNMTHEFKTPIATISLAADSINSPKILSNETQVKRYADIIKQENSRMLNQVEKVLQIAQLDKEDFQLKLSNVNVNDIVHTAAQNTMLKVNQRGGSVTALLAARSANILGDENHISNLIHNLLDNANKYSPDSPQISIETNDAKGGVQIQISDKGIGMSKEDLKRIFEKFYRVSTGNLHDVKGFGLGLSYVKAITDAHKGRVSVESELGKGSTFKVFFPHDLVNVK